MGFSASEEYPVGVEAAIEYFGDDAATRARYEAAGDRDIEVVENETTGGSLRVVTQRVVEIDLPGFAKKVLAPSNTMVQTDVWDAPEPDGSRFGTFEIEVKGAPVATSGTMALEPTDGGCRHTINGEVEVKVPVIGGRIAKFAEGAAGDRAAADCTHNNQSLSG